MRTYGDIPEDHLVILEELELLEHWFNEHGDTMSALAAAKGLVCMSHDYMCMDFEEEVERLFKVVEKRSPGYFKAPIHIHTRDDREFAQLVKGLVSDEISFNLMKSFGYEEQV